MVNYGSNEFGTLPYQSNITWHVDTVNHLNAWHLRDVNM